MKTPDLRRIFAMFGIAVLFPACASIESRPGLHLSNRNNTFDSFKCVTEHPKRYGADQNLWLQDAAIGISISPTEKEHVLLTGPGFLVPLPVLPWPPGIFSALFSKPKHETEPVTVTVHFLTWIQGMKEPLRHYTCRPKEAVIESAGRRLAPASIEVSSDTFHGYTTQEVNVFKDPCARWNGDTLEIQTQRATNCSDVYVTLRFDLPASQLQNGSFEPGPVTLDGKPVQGLVSGIEHRKRHYLWWLYSINS